MHYMDINTGRKYVHLIQWSKICPILSTGRKYVCRKNVRRKYVRRKNVRRKYVPVPFVLFIYQISVDQMARLFFNSKKLVKVWQKLYYILNKTLPKIAKRLLNVCQSKKMAKSSNTGKSKSQLCSQNHGRQVKP